MKMIVFEGKLSKEAIDRAKRETHKAVWCIDIFLLIVGIIPFSFFPMAKNVDAESFWFAFFWLTLCLISGALLHLPTLCDVSEGVSRIIHIGEEYLYCEFAKKNNLYGKKVLRDIGDVAKVKDFGSYYCLYFSFGRQIWGWICQKDLLVEGSLEEFEALFEDRLIRQNDN